MSVDVDEYVRQRNDAARSGSTFDPLTVEQRNRLVVIDEVLRLTIGEDPSPADVIAYAVFVLTGEQPPKPTPEEIAATIRRG